ncbi:hypothetical protein CAOG_010141 [Capsaspora owczarzaki ATCC 30864]|uniref:Uncharacterized protein n=1 Tax=Capsaspora owczarzaki (strain ATCC 30864) TaxID=595528 RepID=A0A0D2WWY2_CAPO3|nr:hypothetical protein CAOG_010141 [Capsaspora owczarzaki ATCC 30864]
MPPGFSSYPFIRQDIIMLYKSKRSVQTTVQLFHKFSTRIKPLTLYSSSISWRPDTPTLPCGKYWQYCLHCCSSVPSVVGSFFMYLACTPKYHGFVGARCACIHA